MSRRGENIFKRKDGRWEGRFIAYRTEHGKPIYRYVYARTYRECKEKRDRAMVVAKTEKIEESAKSIQFGQISSKWMQNISNQVKPSTIAKYTAILNLYLLPYFEQTPIEAITNKDIQVFIGRLLESGKKNESGLAPKTVSDVLSVMKNIFLYAENNGFSVQSDTCRVRIKQEKKILQILTREEQMTLYKNLIDSKDLRDTGIILCMYTGLRVGELCALKWDDISLAERRIHVKHTLQRLQNNANNDSNKKTVVTVSSPKSISSIRIIPICDDAFNLLSAVKNQNGYFLTGEKDSFIEPRIMQYHFKKVLRHCSIHETNFHTLRHTFATRCIELGFDAKSLSEILGHANVGITMNRYVHPSFEIKQQNMQRLSQIFSVS